TSSIPGTIQYTPPAGTVLNAGTWTLSATFTPNDPASYNTASTNVVLVVTRQSLVVKAVAVSKIYGSPNPAFSLQYHGFVNGDSQTNLGGNIQFTTTATQTS